jgi:galactokinase
MARLAQHADHEWVGIQSGIMDQLVSALGRAGHALLIDCRTLESTHIPLPSGAMVVVLDTGTRRGLVGSAYNERFRQCQAAARFFGVTALRDVSLEQLERERDALESVTYHRARHVISENERTLAAVESLCRGDVAAFGKLMNASHISLRDDYEVSSEGLNLMVELAWGQRGCLGARMTGAGFGGCAVALVDRRQVQAFTRKVGEAYRRETGITAQVYVCSAMDGAGVVF